MSIFIAFSLILSCSKDFEVVHYGKDSSLGVYLSIFSYLVAELKLTPSEWCKKTFLRPYLMKFPKLSIQTNLVNLKLFDDIYLGQQVRNRVAEMLDFAFVVVLF